MTDKLIQDYIEMERERCAQLCEALPSQKDHGFLIYCIRAPVMLKEVADFRQRYADTPKPSDDIEDLM